MKKVTFTVDGLTNNADINAVSGALNGLSGIVAADVGNGKAYAYSGDRLDAGIMEDAIKKAGYRAKTVDEDYLHGIPK